MSPRRVSAASAIFLAVALAASRADAANGRNGGAIYAANCAYCHGSTGKGDGPNAAKASPKPPSLVASHLGETEIAGIVRDGKHACPSWKSSLSEDEIQAVAAWARKLQH